MPYAARNDARSGPWQAPPAETVSRVEGTPEQTGSTIQFHAQASPSTQHTAVATPPAMPHSRRQHRGDVMKIPAFSNGLARGGRVLLLACVLLANACRVPPASHLQTIPKAAEASWRSVRFVPAACRFQPPARFDVTCGDLTVPEDYTRPYANPIRLHVAIVHSRSAQPAPDPLLFLQGGPGSRALDSLTRIITQFAGVLATRELIVFDQRGVGYSQPSLNCPELHEAAKRAVVEDLDRTRKLAADLAAIDACRARLTTAGINLGAYTTTAVAHDAAALMQALGYASWNVYGISYGTRPALELLYANTPGLRTAVLDAPCPLDFDLSAEVFDCYRAALEQLFVYCQTNAACYAAHPDLEAELHQLADALDAQALVVPVRLAYPQAGGWHANVHIDGTDLLHVVLQMLHNPNLLPRTPDLIAQVAGGDTNMLAHLLQPPTVQLAVSEGMNLSVTCSDTCFTHHLEANAASDEAPAWLHALALNDMAVRLARCQVWLGDRPTASRPPVRSSDIPALVLTGELDTVALPAWAQVLPDRLTNSTLLTFTAVGHGVMSQSECGRTAVGIFLADPTAALDLPCQP